MVCARTLGTNAIMMMFITMLNHGLGTIGMSQLMAINTMNLICILNSVRNREWTILWVSIAVCPLYFHCMELWSTQITTTKVDGFWTLVRIVTHFVTSKRWKNRELHTCYKYGRDSVYFHDLYVHIRNRICQHHLPNTHWLYTLRNEEERWYLWPGFLQM